MSNEIESDKTTMLLSHQYQANPSTYTVTGYMLPSFYFLTQDGKKEKRSYVSDPIKCKVKGTVKFENYEAIRKFGIRMREARELCNYTQVVAARYIGYQNSTKLNKIENGTDGVSVPLWVILQAVHIYSVSADFLLGISDDWERDPVVSQQREISRWLLEHWEQAKIAEVNSIRVLYNKVSVLEKVAAITLERSSKNIEAIEQVRKLNPEFDELKGGAKLLRLLVETAEAAMGLSYELKRYRALADIAKTNNVNLDIFKDGV